ncbi:MAG: hypothetical protein ACR2NZ_07190 [Rubripirellula sp.]
MSDDTTHFSPLLDAFPTSDPLRSRLLRVLFALPTEVQQDFLCDPRFRIMPLSQKSDSDDATLLALPAADGSGSRCVVLKRRLASCSEAFGLYVIAHELAHAHLHNGPWGEIRDPEDAADALAESWGFPRPASWF